MNIAEKKLSADLTENTVNIRAMLNETSELVIKYARVAGNDVAVITCEGMINSQTIADMIYPPLNSLEHRTLSPDDLARAVQSRMLLAVDVKQAVTYGELSRFFMSGFAIILIDGVDTASAIAVQGFNTRAVSPPMIHSNLRGACEGFTENLRTNLSLVRRRLKSPEFVVKTVQAGDLSNTDIAVCYLQNKAAPDMVEQILQKVGSVPLSMILEGGYVEPFLQDEGTGVFSQVGVTDRPDSFAAKLYDGRIGVIVDGTPYAMFLPLLFTEHFQTMDDYSGQTVFAAFTRILKYSAFFVALLLPGFFVALTNFNPELFPPAILFNIISAEQKTPFTILTECVIILFVYEIMREAGLRLPAVVGHAVSIVGGLILGDIVVSVGLISAPIVLIVALSVISSFVVPDLYPAIAILRFAFVLAGGFFGLFGLTVLAMIVLLKVCSQSAYGVPYTAPLTPFTAKAMRDYFHRRSWRKLAESDVNINEMTGVSKSE